MPRQMRDLGETGWAHIILQGMNREKLFFDLEDYCRFSSTVDRFRKETGFKIEVSCLMNNHVHLLMYAKNGTHAQVIKKIAVSYAAYYNAKYNRAGHVFQDRFRSEPVNDEEYLLTVARYIYLNPQKAGICRAEIYPFTYLKKDGIVAGHFNSPEELHAFLETENEDMCQEFDSKKVYDYTEALELMAAISGCDNPQDIRGLDKAQRNAVLHKMKEAGFSVRRIARLTGIGRNIIQRA